MRGVSLKWVLYIIKRDERNILLLDYEAIIQETAPAVAEHMFDQNKLSVYQKQIGHVEDFHILVALAVIETTDLRRAETIRLYEHLPS